MLTRAQLRGCLRPASIVLLAMISATGVDGAAQAAVRQPPILTAFALNDGASVVAFDTPVVLTHTAVGALPTSYRVSARADFAGAAWLPYTRRIEVSQSEWPATPGCEAPGASRRLRLFLQVRATLGDEVRIAGGQRTLVPAVVESNVLADSICVATHPSP